jgi:hypothetical protein
MTQWGIVMFHSTVPCERSLLGPLITVCLCCSDLRLPVRRTELPEFRVVHPVQVSKDGFGTLPVPVVLGEFVLVGPLRGLRLRYR